MQNDVNIVRGIQIILKTKRRVKMKKVITLIFFLSNFLNAQKYLDKNISTDALNIQTLQYKWTKIFEATDMPENWRVEPFSYDRVHNILYSADSESGTFGAFDLNTNEWRQITADSWFGRMDEFVFDPSKRRILGWRSGTDKVYAISVEGGSWSQITNGNSDSYHYGATPYWNSLTNTIGFTDGYGFYTMHNSIYEVDATTGNWIQKRVDSNDGNPPRANSYYSENEDGTKLYRLNGGGNLTGEQYVLPLTYSNGPNYCWTRGLWELDLSTYTYKTIIPLDDPAIVNDGAFTYDYKRNTFYIIGGKTAPTTSHNLEDGEFNNKVFKYKPGENDKFEEITTLGIGFPLIVQYGSAYYDGINDRIIFVRSDGIWALSITEQNQLSWGLQIIAQNDNVNDSLNIIGVSKDASPLFDLGFDEVEPPNPPGDFISLYFPHPEWNHELSDNFTKDIRDSIDLSDNMQTWSFEVLTNKSGQVDLSFAFYKLNLPIVLLDTQLNAKISITPTSIYSFNALENTTYKFEISVGDTTTPTLNLGSSCSGPSILISNSNYMLQWNSNDGYMVDSVSVYFSSDSGFTFTLVKTLSDIQEYLWKTPNSILIQNGIIKIKLKDFAGNTISQQSDYPFIIAGNIQSKEIIAGWQLWGAPLIPDNDTMKINLEDDLSSYWITYDYANGGYTFDGFLQPSKGYWLGCTENTIVDVEGVPVDKQIKKELELGWNLLSNPFLLEISVDSLIFNNGIESVRYNLAVDKGWVNSIYKYNGNSYYSDEMINPWEGFWISVLKSNISIEFPIHRNPSKSKLLKTNSATWAVNFTATSSKSKDLTTSIGTNQNASKDFDNEFDKVKAPIPPSDKYISLNILHPEWNHILGEKFAVDIINDLANDEFYTWELENESSEENVVLTWELENIPEEINIYIQKADRTYIDIKNNDSMILASGERFKVIAGDFQVDVKENFGAPQNFALHQNYPNPFNPSTMIKYSIPEESNIKIEIYNMLGQRVGVLVNVEKSVGYYETVWNASNLPSGIYLISIRAIGIQSKSSFNQVRKALLLK